jgi:ParB-like chromosome segregation protein Spo0J
MHKTFGKVLPISQVRSDPNRIPYAPDALADAALITSIERFGILAPLIVAKVGRSRYIVIDGFRRLEAARKLRYKSVPCTIHHDLPHEQWEVLRFRLHATFKPWTQAERAKAKRRLRTLGQTPQF